MNHNKQIPFRQYGSLFVTYLKTQKLKVSLLAILLFGSIGLQLINPQVVRYFIDKAMADGATQ